MKVTALNMTLTAFIVFAVAAFLPLSSPGRTDPKTVRKDLENTKIGDSVPRVDLPSQSNATSTIKSHLQGIPHFWKGFVSAFSVIIISEIGDKTFFIAAIMASRHQALVVFAGATSALVIMTMLSALMGSLTHLIPRVYTHYASIVLFIFFGVKMLYEAGRMSDTKANKEFEEVQQELNERGMRTSSTDSETLRTSTKQSRLYTILSRVFWQSLALTFVAEWGDRSQLATIILAARENVWAVNIGAIAGHLICTGLAVVAGSVIAKRVSVKTLTYIGGCVFLVFAVWAFFMGPDSDVPAMSINGGKNHS